MRDFEEEYKNYIHEEIPNLWDRIEAELPEKQTPEKQHRDSRKFIYFIQRSMPAVAALCVLMIGFGAIRLSNRSKSENAACEEITAVTEQAVCDEAPEYEETATSDDGTDINYADMEDKEEAVAGTTETTEAAEAAESAGVIATDSVQSVAQNTLTSDTDGIIYIEAATLIGIEMADADLQEEGFAYIYRFRLTDSNTIEVYLTQDQCDDLEKEGIPVERHEKYDLDAEVYSGTDNSAENGRKKEAVMECTLVEMKLH